MSLPIYLGYNATTPVDPEVADAMLPYLRGHFGNPSSNHVYGRRAQDAVAQARGQVAALNGHPEERLSNTLHVSFPGVSGRELLAGTPAVAASVGSACHDQGDAVRGVLGAMGTPPERARGAVRFSIGEPTTEDEIRQTADALIATWRSLTAP